MENEVAVTNEVKRVLISELSNLEANKNFVVEHTESIGDLKSIYDILGISPDYFKILLTTSRSNTSWNRLNLFQGAPSYSATIYQKANFHNPYNTGGTISLLGREKAESQFSTERYGHNFSTNVGGITIQFPSYYSEPFLPAVLTKDETSKYFLETLGCKFEISKICENWSNQYGYSATEKSDDHKISKLLYFYNNLKNAYRVKDFNLI